MASIVLFPLFLFEVILYRFLETLLVAFHSEDIVGFLFNNSLGNLSLCSYGINRYNIALADKQLFNQNREVGDFASLLFHPSLSQTDSEFSSESIENVHFSV